MGGLLLSHPVLVIDSPNPRVVWVVRDLNAHPVPTPAMRRDASYQMRLLKSTPNLASHPCPMHKNIVDLGHKLNCVKPQIFVPMDSSREDVQVSP